MDLSMPEEEPTQLLVFLVSRPTVGWPLFTNSMNIDESGVSELSLVLQRRI